MDRITCIGVVLTIAILRVTAKCPSECTCGPVKDEWTYETEFTVSCSRLTLSDIPVFEGWDKVDVLNLTGHKISVVRNNAFKGIMPKKILLDNNIISHIEPEAFADVAEVTEVVDLSQNRISKLPQGLAKLKNLKKLKLIFNPTLNLDTGSFKGLSSLTRLDLSQCGLDSIPDDVFQDVSETLEELVLSYNRLTSVPLAIKRLHRLEKIEFDSNEITYVPAHAFEGMNNLKKLELSRCELSDGSSIHPLAFVDVASTLEDLDFYHTDLTYCPSEALSPLKKLKTLSFNSNNIANFPPRAFQTLDALTELALSGNRFRFSREMFEGIEDTLHTLLIRRMELTELPVEELSVLRKLQWIDASGNAFTTLNDNFTQGLAANRYTLQWMKIRSISPKAFSGKSRPIHLSVMDNKLTNLDFVEEPCDFEYVEVEQNPLICDCHTAYIAMHPDVVLAGMCSGPPEFANMDISGETFRQASRRICSNRTEFETKYCPRRYEQSMQASSFLILANRWHLFAGILSSLALRIPLYI